MTRFLLCASVVPLLAGCTISFNSSPSSWKSTSVTLKAPGEEAAKIQVQTHNGYVRVAGDSDEKDIQIAAKVKGGGNSPKDAQDALDAINVFARSKKDTLEVGWDWKVDKKRSWAAEVSFDIKVPKHLEAIAETHNGDINIGKLDGPLKMTSHNGNIEAVAANALVAETHNGSVKVTATSQVKVETHNGSVQVNLTANESPKGSISTHNGGVTLQLGEKPNVRLDCRSDNGGVKIDHRLSNRVEKDNHIRGELGSGGELLKINTHNGSIKIK